MDKTGGAMYRELKVGDPYAIKSDKPDHVAVPRSGSSGVRVSLAAEAPWTFRLQPLPPFRLDLTAWAVISRPENLMDRWVDASFQRVLPISGRAALITATQSGGRHHPVLEIRAEGVPHNLAAEAAVEDALCRLLGMAVDLRRFYRFARHDERLHHLVSRFRGLKPPRFPTVFEALLNAMACQQLSLAAGITLLNRLAAACGLEYRRFHAFPRPEDVARLRSSDVHSLGFSRNKARAMLEAASAAAEGRLDLEALSQLGSEAAVARLLELRGVGRWTAEYVLLRGLGRTDLFPGDDVGARNNLSRWLHLRKPLDYDRVGHILRQWSPYDGLIYFHMLLSGLEHAGKLVPPKGEPS